MTAKVKKVLILIPIILLSVFILAAIGFGIYFAVITKDAKLNKNLLPTAKATPVFFDVNGEEIPYFSKNKIEVDEIPSNLYSAFVAIEDKRFFEHNGIDYKRIAGAMLSNLKAGSNVEGASTITQQLVKNTHLTQEKSLNRKLKEMVIAKQLEKEYSKDEIMAMYLSVIYFGKGAYGVKEAANLYFSKSIDQLTLSECATLAGTVKNPSRYAPDKGNAISRRNLVLKLMLEQGKISEKEYDAAKAEEIAISTANISEENGEKFYLKNCISELTSILNVTNYELENMGLKVFTFYNPDLQKILISSMKTCNSDSMGIIVDNIINGVSAYYSTGGTAQKRQAGSSLKPLAVYAPALNENLIYTVSPIKDEKINFGTYSPKNYENKYYGWTTVEQAVIKSMNS
ncbi:MAG: transglycosylase domain-containing protein, partial [Christensenellales bacterium]